MFGCVFPRDDLLALIQNLNLKFKYFIKTICSSKGSPTGVDYDAGLFGCSETNRNQGAFEFVIH